MHLSALTLVPLATVSSAFVINTYETAACEGDPKRVNVYDNTCADWNSGFLSFEIEKLGGPNQTARFYSRTGCFTAGQYGGTPADGRSPTFQVGTCADLSFPIYSASSLPG